MSSMYCCSLSTYSVTACMILLYAVNSPVIGYLTGNLCFLSRF